eukprot:m.132345 g.132345  ORF g.132345 m.132345 type:complete len:322 (-) comp15925_c0_seq12:473-1438(-)
MSQSQQPSSSCDFNSTCPASVHDNCELPPSQDAAILAYSPLEVFASAWQASQGEPSSVDAHPQTAILDDFSLGGLSVGTPMHPQEPSMLDLFGLGECPVRLRSQTDEQHQATIDSLSEDIHYQDMVGEMENDPEQHSQSTSMDVDQELSPSPRQALEASIATFFKVTEESVCGRMIINELGNGIPKANRQIIMYATCLYPDEVPFRMPKKIRQLFRKAWKVVVKFLRKHAATIVNYEEAFNRGETGSGTWGEWPDELKAFTVIAKPKCLEYLSQASGQTDIESELEVLGTLVEISDRWRKTFHKQQQRAALGEGQVALDDA